MAERRVKLQDFNRIPSADPEQNGEPDPEVLQQLFALPLTDFLAEPFPVAPPQMGTKADTILPAGGLAIVAGMPGVGKTTLVLDAIFHLADGKDWLGIKVERPLKVLVVENEGPQRKFQEKLQRKHDAWGGKLQGEIAITIWNWGSFNFTEQSDVEAMEQWIREEGVDVVVGDPLDTLGVQGVGSPEDTRAFVASLVPLGLTRTTSFVFLHHFRKEVTANEIHQVSGAWGGRLDTLMVLRETERPDELRLSFPKLRWASERRPLILGKLTDSEAFDVIGEETHDTAGDATDVETMLNAIIEALRASKEGVVDRTALALKVGSAPSNRTFQRALRHGWESDRLAKQQHGRSVSYSLTKKSW